VSKQEIREAKAMSHVIVFTTTASKEEAENIARSLLSQKLIGCANITGPVSSLFWWKDEISQENEFLILMKTRADLFEKVAATIKEMHSYDVPEVVAVSVTKGEEAYLKWLDNCLQKGEWARGDD
jgi:periplasmic divalent cation tolerance protein